MSKSPQNLDRLPSDLQRNFIEWKRKFRDELESDPVAKRGLNKWIEIEKVSRKEFIDFVERGINAGQYPATVTQKLRQPNSAGSDVTQELWARSIPNVDQRKSSTREDKKFLGELVRLADATEELANRMGSKRSIVTEDRFFELPLDGVRRTCAEFAARIRSFTSLAERKYVQPIKIEDCCIALVVAMENRGLSQHEAHALIHCSLLSHGLSEKEARPFDEGSVYRKTIRAKKEALKERVLEVVEFLHAKTHGFDVGDERTFTLESRKRKDALANSSKPKRSASSNKSGKR